MNLNIFKKKSTLDVKVFGDKVLKTRAMPVESVDRELVELASVMERTMFKSDGIGLAAPQVGLSIRMFILNVPKPDTSKIPVSSPGELFLFPKMPVAVINPEVTVISDTLTIAEEGCLSVPGIYARVKRPDKIMLSAQLITGENINFECGGFLARVIQHEFDHLEGILFVERLDADESDKIKIPLRQLKKTQKSSTGKK